MLKVKEMYGEKLGKRINVRQKGTEAKAEIERSEIPTLRELKAYSWMGKEECTMCIKIPTLFL